MRWKLWSSVFGEVDKKNIDKNIFKMILQSFCQKFFCQKCSATRIVSQSLALTNPTRKRGGDGSLEYEALIISQMDVNLGRHWRARLAHASG